MGDIVNRIWDGVEWLDNATDEFAFGDNENCPLLELVLMPLRAAVAFLLLVWGYSVMWLLVLGDCFLYAFFASRALFRFTRKRLGISERRR